MNNKILIFSSRQLCYNSASSFADSLAREFSNMGYEVETCNFQDSAMPPEADDDMAPPDTTFGIGEEVSDLLKGYSGREYLAVFDFNSKLPRVILEDNSYYLDSINAPFYDYILDNPLYHHKVLRNELKNYHIITPDRNHADYVRRYYPNVRSVLFQTIGASEGCSPVPFEEKEKCILMAGTYRNPEGYRAVLEAVPAPLGPIKLKVCELLMADEKMTIEEGLHSVLAEYGYIDEGNCDPKFAAQMHDFYTVEKFLRNYYRDMLLGALISNRMPLRLMGSNWSMFGGRHAESVSVSLPVDYLKSYEKTANAAILADVSPFFKGGLHDRVPMGFANRTLLLTDENEYIKELFGDDCPMLTYALKDLRNASKMAEICDCMRELMNNKVLYEIRAEQAYEVYRKNYTWRKVAENILEQVEKDRAV